MGVVMVERAMSRGLSGGGVCANRGFGVPGLFSDPLHRAGVTMRSGKCPSISVSGVAVEAEGFLVAAWEGERYVCAGLALPPFLSLVFLARAG